jgi:hypothetical protein
MEAASLSPKLQMEVRPPSGPVKAANTSGSRPATSRTGRSWPVLPLWMSGPGLCVSLKNERLLFLALIFRRKT